MAAEVIEFNAQNYLEESPILEGERSREMSWRLHLAPAIGEAALLEKSTESTVRKPLGEMPKPVAEAPWDERVF